MFFVKIRVVIENFWTYWICWKRRFKIKYFSLHRKMYFVEKCFYVRIQSVIEFIKVIVVENHNNWKSKTLLCKSGEYISNTIKFLDQERKMIWSMKNKYQFFNERLQRILINYTFTWYAFKSVAYNGWFEMCRKFNSFYHFIVILCFKLYSIISFPFKFSREKIDESLVKNIFSSLSIIRSRISSSDRWNC